MFPKKVLVCCSLLVFLFFPKISLSSDEKMGAVYSVFTQKQLQKIEDFARLIHSSGVPELSPEKLMEGALNGMGTALDRYSGYLSPTGRKEIIQKIRGDKNNEENLVFDRLGDNIAYIKMGSFTESVKYEWKGKWEDLKSGGEIQGIILDLRNNFGGLLEVAIFVAEFFLEEDLVVVRRDGRYQVLTEITDYPDDTGGIPMAVLVNSNSISASEVLALALQSNKRATIVGENTFGKGREQVVIPQIDGSLFVFTDAILYGPRGEVLDGKGVAPDIYISDKSSGAEDRVLEGALSFLKRQ